MRNLVGQSWITNRFGDASLEEAFAQYYAHHQLKYVQRVMFELREMRWELHQLRGQIRPQSMGAMAGSDASAGWGGARDAWQPALPYGRAAV